MVRNVTGIATQGSQLGNWVTKYVVNYSVDGLQWQTFRNESGTVQVTWLSNMSLFVGQYTMHVVYIKSVKRLL